MTLDEGGKFLWCKTLDGARNSGGNSIATDIAGDLYITGTFLDSLDFDPGIGTEIHFASDPDGTFVLKLDKFGNFVWVRTFESDFWNHGYEIEFDKEGNFFVSGNFWGIADFDPGPGVASLTSHHNPDAFLQKFDQEGNLIWVKTFGEVSAGSGKCLAVSSSGNIYVAGEFHDSLFFDSFNSDIPALVDSGLSDFYLFQFNEDGEMMEVHSFGGPGYDFIESIAADNSGNIYLTGRFEDSLDFDPGSNKDVHYVPDLRRHVYITKLTDTTQYSSTTSLSFIIYPNPTEDWITVEFEEVQNKVEIEITNVLGQNLGKATFLNSRVMSLQIPISQGLYFVNVITGNGITRISRVVKD